jgi:hypothetical protein
VRTTHSSRVETFEAKNHRYYEEKFPKVDAVVMVKVMKWGRPEER